MTRQNLDYSKTKFLMQYEYMSRYDLINIIEDHGFIVEEKIDQGLPILQVTGMWYGNVLKVVTPEFPLADHSRCLQDIYLVMGASLSDLFKWYGNC